MYRAKTWLSQREVLEAWKGPLASESAVHGFVARASADAGRRERRELGGISVIVTGKMQRCRQRYGKMVSGRRYGVVAT